MVRTKITKPIQPKKPKKTVVKERSEKPYCCICMDEIKPKNLASLDVCDHKYCKGCIETWAKTENSCPQCKRKFKKIVHIKKGCKKKKVSTEVEDKRQRPDHYDDDDFTDAEFEHAISSLSGDTRAAFYELERVLTEAENSGMTLSARNTILEAQVRFANVASDPNIISSVLQCGVHPFDTPINDLYNLHSRINIILHFHLDHQFSQYLSNSLMPLLPSAPRRLRLLSTKAEMIFNVIDRFMSSMEWCRTITFTRNNIGAVLSLSRDREVWKQLKVVVWGIQGSREQPIDVENSARPRRPHPPLEVCAQSSHKFLLWMKETASQCRHRHVYV